MPDSDPGPHDPDAPAGLICPPEAIFDRTAVRAAIEARIGDTTDAAAQRAATVAVLRGALDRNASAIRANMAAMRELVGMLHASALRDSTDGTYNRPGSYGQAG